MRRSSQEKWKWCKRLKKKEQERMRKLAKLGMLLLFPVLLIGCAGRADVATVDRDALCKDWRHGTISKQDKLTEETASQIEANNKSRPAWGCAYGRNETEPKQG
jgi:hypothetical protein